MSIGALLKLADFCQHHRAESSDSNLGDLQGGSSCPLFPPALTEPERNDTRNGSGEAAVERGLEPPRNEHAAGRSSAVLADDRAETVDLAAKHPEKVNELEMLWNTQTARMSELRNEK